VLAAAAFFVPVVFISGAASGLGAWLGAWWVPFLVGAAVGALGRAGARRGLVLAGVAGAVVGWTVPLWALALDGQPVGATSRAVAALAGLPPYAGVTIAVVLLLAALQVLVGAWLARAVLPKKKTGEQEAVQP